MTHFRTKMTKNPTNVVRPTPATTKATSTTKTATIRDVVRGTKIDVAVKATPKENPATYDSNVVRRSADQIAAPTAEQARAAVRARMPERYDADEQPITVADVIAAASKNARDARAEIDR